MIIERLVFRAKFGEGDAVAEAFRQWRDRFAARFGAPTRILVDVTGPMFTIVAETEYCDLAHVAELQQREQELYGDPEFQQWFGTWSTAVETGSRELYRVLA